ncbi:MAG: aldo/keto reductase [Betaproteobacteria bacterium]
MRPPFNRQRRTFVTSLSGLGGLLAAPSWAALPVTQPDRSPICGTLLKMIPASGERIPAVGMGSWLTFDIAERTDSAVRTDQLRAVLRTFFDLGGALIDTSPMYGSSEQGIGELLRPGVNAVPKREQVFAASKVWTIGEAAGAGQMATSLALWRAGSPTLPGKPRFDLMQIHNMLDWQTHLRTLKAWKAAGRIRYIGITTSHGRRHEDLEAAMKRERFDFVQFTYNLADRAAESRPLPLARDRGTAVIINRQFDGGALFRQVRGSALPAWAAELGCL